MSRFSFVEHLRVPFGPGLYHHGLRFDRGPVFHMSGLNMRDGKAGASPHWTTFERFAGKAGAAAVEVVPYAPGAVSPVDVVLARTERVKGQRDYDLFENNCETIARWCMTGEKRSAQADGAKGVGLGVGVGGTAVVTTVRAVATGASGARIMANLAGAGGGSAATGVAVLTAAPAAFATAGVHRAFRDDPAAPLAENQARLKARSAGTVAAWGSGLGMLGAIYSAGVPGLSAAGITSGLVGVGGTMAGGVAVTVAAPIALAFVVATLVYRASKR